MSDLSVFRDHARRMASGRPLTRAGQEDLERRNNSRRQVGLPPLPGPLEVPESDRVLWGRLAAECDAYLGTMNT